MIVCLMHNEAHFNYTQTSNFTAEKVSNSKYCISTYLLITSMASLLNRPSNYVRRTSTIQQAEENDEDSYDFDIYDDDSYDYDDSDEEREILIANDTFNQLNLHVLLYVAAWYTGKKLQHSVPIPVPVKYENFKDTETTTKRSQRFRSTARFTTASFVQLTLSEITTERYYLSVFIF